MQRTQLTALLDDAKANNGGSPNFVISISDDGEARSAMTILKHFQVAGTITSFSRADPPDDNVIEIIGYTG